MKKATMGTAARAYLVLMLVLAVLFASQLELGLALVLIAIQMYSFYKVQKASVNLALVLASLILAPLALEALVGVYAFLLIVPALFLLDESLKVTAVTQVVSFHRLGRKVSDVLKVLCGCLLLVLVVSVIVWNLTLLLTVAALLGFIGILTVSSLSKLPNVSMVESKSWSRIVAGDTEVKEFSVKGQARIPIHVKLEPVDSWVHLEPQNVTLPVKGDIEATVQFTPPLAGSSKILIKAVFMDTRGLVEIGQTLQPLDLHIIPRAKYAQWLANKYLEQTASGAGIMADVQRSKSTVAKHGIEFQGNRPYQVGDRLKDIDWKHSYMLNEVIVKEFSGEQGNTGIIVADLTANDLEDADVLAYNFVMSALTLAIESLPSALAVYNQKEVISVTGPTDPRETLKKAIMLTEKIIVTESKLKVLNQAELGMLKRSISQLDQVEIESANKLSELLRIEVDANQEAAKTHPSTLALSKAVENRQGPAVITVVSSLNTDSDALSMELEKLKKAGYSTIFIGER
jgi:uncharacterized protein (DUF58 family)